MWKTETKDISSLNYYNYDGKQWTEIGRDAHFRNNIINSILDMLSLLSEEIYNRQLYMVSVSIVYCVYDVAEKRKKMWQKTGKLWKLEWDDLSILTKAGGKC